MKDNTIFERQINVFTDVKIGMYYCGKRVETLFHSYGPQIRNHYLFVLVNKGKAVLHGEKDISFGAHDLLVMFPGERVHYEALTPWSIQWVGLYGDSVASYVRQLGLHKQNPIMHVPLYMDAEGILEKLYEMGGDLSSSASLMQSGLILQLFSVLLRFSKQKQSVDYVSEALRIIEHNFNNGISVQKLANALHVDHSYFSRLFTKTVGTSPKKAIIKKQMEMAKALLEETDMPIAEIATSVGIHDALYFSKLFSRMEGISPTDYRKKNLCITPV